MGVAVAVAVGVGVGEPAAQGVMQIEPPWALNAIGLPLGSAKA